MHAKRQKIQCEEKNKHQNQTGRDFVGIRLEIKQMMSNMLRVFMDKVDGWHVRTEEKDTIDRPGGRLLWKEI